MGRSFEFHPAAEAEVLEAEAWYLERSDVAARAFVHEVNHVIEQMIEAPERWPPFEQGTHRIVFPTFPFTLIYRIKPEVIEIVAVAHQSRRPGYWKSR